jgi:hypothetical protein
MEAGDDEVDDPACLDANPRRQDVVVCLIVAIIGECG